MIKKMFKTITNLGFKALILGSALYGSIQFYGYVKDTYNSFVGVEAKNPVVDTLDDMANRTGEYLRQAGDAVSGSVENCRPYLEPLEDKVMKNGNE